MAVLAPGNGEVFQSGTEADLPSDLRKALLHAVAGRPGLTCSESGRNAHEAALPSTVLYRRTRRIAPSPPGGISPRRGNLFTRWLFFRPHVLSRGSRRPLHASLPCRDTATALGHRAGRRSVCRNAPAPRPPTARAGDGIASLSPRQPNVRRGGAAGNCRRGIGLGSSPRPYLFAALDLAAAAGLRMLLPHSSPNPLTAGTS